MTWLLKLYPAGWRERYGAEVAEVVASQPASLRLFVDLLGGAIDAHWTPQRVAQRMEGAAAVEGGGSDMLTRLRGCCATPTLTTRESLLSGAATIVLTLAFLGLQIGLKRALGPHPAIEAIMMLAFPGSMMLATQPLYLRGRSTAVKVSLTLGPVALVYAIGLVAFWINAR